MMRGRGVIAAGLCSAALLVVAAAGSAGSSAVTRLSTDPFANSTSRHRTEVEPDTFAFGSTIVAATQVGRFYDGGSSGIGFATSTNGGATWTSGVLPGITKFTTPPGPYDRASDPSVAYDPVHDVWMISSLALTEPDVGGAAVVVNRSTDGGLTWSGAVTVATASGNSDFDKNWTACDQTHAPSPSPFAGSCYTEYDDFGAGNQVHVAYSRDGGLTWQEGTLPTEGVLGGQPVVQPDGDVIMPIDDENENHLLSFRSTDGGVTWSDPPVTIAQIASHTDAGNLRSGPLPSAEIDANGKVYVVWADCRFRSNCKANDIVMTTSTDGLTWTPVVRIPIDKQTSNVDHFLPGLAVDPTTGGATAKLALTYYFYPKTKCSPSSCKLKVGYVSSGNGGSSWSSAKQVGGSMKPKWLPDTSQGRMVGDYISTSISAGRAFGVFALAKKPSRGGPDCATATPNCDQAIFAPAGGLALRSGSVRVETSPGPGGPPGTPQPGGPRSAR